MPAAPFPENEAQRLEAVRALKLLDTPPEERFDRITRLAARILGVPMAFVSLIDENRQFIKSSYGFDLVEPSRDAAFCAYTILENKQLVVPDAKSDSRFSDNPLVTNKPNIRFYAGNPITAADGSRVGTLGVMDRQPRIPSAEDLEALRDLGPSSPRTKSTSATSPPAEPPSRKPRTSCAKARPVSARSSTSPESSSGKPPSRAKPPSSPTASAKSSVTAPTK
jgi:hypothetical protein